MRLVRYNPWTMLDELHNTLGGFVLPVEKPAGNGGFESVSWSPAVDVHEEPSRFVLRLDLPGIDLDNVELTVERGVLTVKGERNEERKSDSQGCHRVERVHGTFKRSFSLPETADSDSVEASYDRGVLEIVLAKKEQAQPRKIRIEHQH